MKTKTPSDDHSDRSELLEHSDSDSKNRSMIICSDSEPDRIRSFERRSSNLERQPSSSHSTTDHPDRSPPPRPRIETIPTDPPKPDRHGNQDRRLDPPLSSSITTSSSSSIEVQPKDRLSNLISKFRHQPSSRTSSSSSSKLPGSIHHSSPQKPSELDPKLVHSDQRLVDLDQDSSILTTNPARLKYSPSNSSQSRSSSMTSTSLIQRRAIVKTSRINRSDEQQLEIGYTTLLRLKSCPACQNEWTTYKAPKSKLTHIQKCARKELIRPNFILERIQVILEQQDQRLARERGLLDRHSSNQNLINTTLDLSTTPEDRTAVLPPLSAIDPNHQAPSTTRKTNWLPSPPKSSARPISPILHSSNLEQVHSKTLARNALVSTKNSRPYSLWEAAGCHDDYDYDRSVVSSNSSAHSFPNEGSAVSPSNRYLRRQSKGKHRLESQSYPLKQLCDGVEDLTISPSKFSLPQESETDSDFFRMPNYDDWTKSDLKNESERLGYEDGSDLSTQGLISRAILGWKAQVKSRSELRETVGSSRKLSQRSSVHRSMPHLVARTNDSDLLQHSNLIPHDHLGDGDADEWSHPTENLDFDSAPSAPDLEGDGDDHEWFDDLLNPEDHHYSPIDPPSSPGSGLSRPRRPKIRPIFESFGKLELELEYAQLKQQILSIDPGGLTQEDERAQFGKIRKEIDHLPKTKPALVKKLIKLWDLLHPSRESNDDDQDGEDPGRLLKSSSSSSIKIVVEKLGLEDLSRLMTRLFDSVEPEFYLRILRYEPIKLSVIEEKIKKPLKEEFEKRFQQVQLDLRQGRTANVSQEKEDEGAGGTRMESGRPGDEEEGFEDEPIDRDDDNRGVTKSKSKKKRSVTKKRKESITLVKRPVVGIETLVRWLDLQAISYFVLDPSDNRRARY